MMLGEVGRKLAWVLALAGLGWGLQSAGVTASLDGFLGDWLQRWPGSGQPAGSPLIHVTVRELGAEGWPMSRLDAALLVHAVSRYGPKVVAVEFPLHGEDTFFPSYDSQLGGLFERAGLVVLGVGLTGEAVEEGWEDWAPPVLPEGVLEPAASYSGLIPPLAVFRSNATPGAGLLLSEPGGVVRKVPLFFKVGKEWMPSLAMQVVAQFWGVHWPATRRGPGGGLVLAGGDGKVLAELPVDRRGMVSVRLDSLPSGQEVEMSAAILASEQMLTDEVPVFNLGLARGKVVLLARGHVESSPVYATARGSLPSGEVQARMIHALLTGAFLREVPVWLNGLSFLIAAMAGVILGGIRTPWVSGAGLVGAGVALVVGSWVAVDAGGWWVPVASLGLVGLVGWAGIRAEVF